MSFPHFLVILSALISLSGGFLYIRSTVTGNTQPNRVSWGLWSLAPLISTGAAIHAGADLWPTSRVFLSGFIPLMVFVSSFFNTRGYWKLNAFDLLCGIFSVIALIAWLAIDLPRLAILFAVLADGFAVLPTIRKAWLFPETENGIAFIGGLIASLIILPAIPVWTIENAVFQIYLILANAIILFSIERRRLGAYFSR